MQSTHQILAHEKPKYLKLLCSRVKIKIYKTNYMHVELNRAVISSHNTKIMSLESNLLSVKLVVLSDEKLQ